MLGGTSANCLNYSSIGIAGLGGLGAGLMKGLLTNAAEAIPGVNLTEAGKEFINAITHPLSFPAEAVAASSEGRR